MLAFTPADRRKIEVALNRISDLQGQQQDNVRASAANTLAAALTIAGALTLNKATGALIVTTAQTPATAAAAGIVGTICWDSGFIYVCVATNTWKRVAIATW